MNPNFLARLWYLVEISFRHGVKDIIEFGNIFKEIENTQKSKC